MERPNQPVCLHCGKRLTPSNFTIRSEEVRNVLQRTPVPLKDLQVFTCWQSPVSGCGLTFAVVRKTGEIYSHCEIFDHRIFERWIRRQPALTEDAVARRYETEGYDRFVSLRRFLKDWAHAKKYYQPPVVETATTSRKHFSQVLFE